MCKKKLLKEIIKTRNTIRKKYKALVGMMIIDIRVQGFKGHDNKFLVKELAIIHNENERLRETKLAHRYLFIYLFVNRIHTF